jgi:hypothetical protein
VLGDLAGHARAVLPADDNARHGEQTNAARGAQRRAQDSQVSNTRLTVGVSRVRL